MVIFHRFLYVDQRVIKMSTTPQWEWCDFEACAIKVSFWTPRIMRDTTGKNGRWSWCLCYPIGSMYIHVCYINGNIYHQYTPNVSIYTIHGPYGYKGHLKFAGHNWLNTSNEQPALTVTLRAPSVATLFGEYIYISLYIYINIYIYNIHIHLYLELPPKYGCRFWGFSDARIGMVYRIGMGQCIWMDLQTFMGWVDQIMSAPDL